MTSSGVAPILLACKGAVNRNQCERGIFWAMTLTEFCRSRIGPLLVVMPSSEYDQAMSNQPGKLQPLLWLGDLVVFLLVTFIGFSSHGTLQLKSLSRMLATLLPFFASWILFSSWSGLMHPPIEKRGTWWLSCGIVAAFSAPLAGTLRALWLGTVVLPTFVLVMAGVSALAIAAWRWLFQAVLLRRVSR